MRTILAILAFVGGFAANAQDITWNKGSVVLATKEVLVGEIARAGVDLVLLKNGNGEVSVYPTRKVSSFRYYDEKENINRAFVAMSGKYYERVVSGTISVFRIQKFFDQKINENNATSFEYFVERGKRVTSIKNFRKKHFNSIKEELELRLVRYKHLDPNTSYGVVSLIMLYNKSEPVLSAI